MRGLILVIRPAKSGMAVRGSGPPPKLRLPPLYECQAGRHPFRPLGPSDSFLPSPPTRSRQFCQEAPAPPRSTAQSGAGTRRGRAPSARAPPPRRACASRVAPGRARPAKTRRLGLCAPHAPPAAATRSGPAPVGRKPGPAPSGETAPRARPRRAPRLRPTSGTRRQAAAVGRPQPLGFLEAPACAVS